MDKEPTENMQQGSLIGLALGGGVVLGAAHIGVLRAMHERRLRAGCIAGTSIGSFIAALHAFGKSWEEIERVALDLDWSDLSGLTLSGYGLLSNRKFGAMVDRLLGSCRIEDSPIPLAIVATDISTGGKVVMRQGDVARAVMSSSSVPGVFCPVESDDMLLVDGVLTENVPISPLRVMGADTIICADLFGRHTFRKPQNVVELLFNAFYSAMSAVSRIQMEGADVVITPDLSNFSLVDISAVPAIIEAGYIEAQRVLDALMDKELHAG
jgi:NTE family protein